MKPSRAHMVTLSLLLLSAGGNLWQYLREDPAEPARAKLPRLATRPVAAFVKDAAPAPKAPPEESEEEVEEVGFELTDEPPEKPSPGRKGEDLIIGISMETSGLTRRPTDEKVSVKRLNELSSAPVPETRTMSVHARLLLPDDRVLDMGTNNAKVAQRMKFERIKEFPFPTQFDPPVVSARASDPFSGKPRDFPVTPTTPAAYASRNTGVGVEFEFQAVAGGYVLKGNMSQTGFEGFSFAPGEVFLPVVDGSGTVLTDNKTLMPRFATYEAPYVAFTQGGETVKVPVKTTFGETILELTCTPVE